MTNAITAATPRNPTTERTDRAADSATTADPAAFRSLLAQQSLGVLVAATDSAATPSPLGVGRSLVDASEQSLDAAGVASASLSAGEAAKGLRERGLDAASSASRELASRPQNPPAPSGPGSPTQPEAAARSEPADSARGTQPDGQAKPDRPAGNARDGQETNAASAPRAAASGAEPKNAGQVSDAAISIADGTRAATAHSQAASTSGTSRAVIAGVAASSGSAKAATPSAIGAGPNQTSNKTTPILRQQAVPSQRAPEDASPTAQVQRGLAQVLRQRGGTLTMRMTPNELGEVKIELRMAQGRVEGVIEASTPVARDLLRRELDQLASSLERRGVTVDRLEVRLREAAESGGREQAGSETRSESGTREDARHERGSGSGGGRNPEHALGGERHGASAGGAHKQTDDTDGARSNGANAEHAGHGRPAEPVGRWLRLDTIG